MADHEQPIIIKKVKKGGHGGHHGGAWKVAYADFVTAMMAFFLVMWILGLSPQEKNRIASFFREPGIFDNQTGKILPMPIEMGFGSKGNEGNGAGTVGMNASEEDLEHKFNNATPTAADSMRKYMKAEAVKDSMTLAQRIVETANTLREQIQEMKAQFPEMKDVLSNVQVSISDEGLRIELVEVRDNVFFEAGSSGLKPAAIKLLSALGASLGKLENHIVLEGHTDSKQYAGSRGGYSNWDLSSERANAARRILETHGLWADQILNVVGCADKHLFNNDNPFDPANRRVSIVVPHVESQALLEQKLKQHNTTSPDGQQKDVHATITGTKYK